MKITAGFLLHLEHIVGCIFFSEDYYSAAGKALLLIEFIVSRYYYYLTL